MKLLICCLLGLMVSLSAFGQAKYKCYKSSTNKWKVVKLKTDDAKLGWDGDDCYNASSRSEAKKICQEKTAAETMSVCIKTSYKVKKVNKDYKCKSDCESFNEKRKARDFCKDLKKRGTKWYCEVSSSGRVKYKKVKLSNPDATEHKGNKLFSSKKEAKKDPSCKSFKDYFYCEGLDSDNKPIVKKISASSKKEARAQASTAANRKRAKVYSSESRASKDKACKPEKTKTYHYCVVDEKGVKSVKEVTVKKKSEAKAQLSADKSNYKIVGRLKTSAAKAEKDRKCNVKSKKFYYCVVENGQRSVKTIETASKRDAKSEYDKVSMEVKGKLFAKETRAQKDKRCDVDSSDLVCYFCDPSAGQVVKVDQGYAEANGVGNMWARLTKKKKSCDQLKRRQIKKALTKTKYLEVEKLLNDSSKYYTRGVLKKLTNSGKKLFKRVQNAPLFDNEAEAKNFYSVIALESNKCYKKTCSDFSEDDHKLKDAELKCTERSLEYNKSTCSCGEVTFNDFDCDNLEKGGKKSFPDGEYLISENKINEKKRLCAHHKGKWVSYGNNSYGCEFSYKGREFSCPIAVAPKLDINLQGRSKESFYTCTWNPNGGVNSSGKGLTPTGESEYKSAISRIKQELDKKVGKGASAVTVASLVKDGTVSCKITVSAQSSHNGLYCNCVEAIAANSGLSKSCPDQLPKGSGLKKDAARPFNDALASLRKDHIYGRVSGDLGGYGINIVKGKHGTASSGTDVYTSAAIKDQYFMINLECKSK